MKPDIALSKPPFTRLVIKLAARCNINCDYCYWFRDKTVYDRPKLLQDSAIAALLLKLENYFLKYEMKEFLIVLHGGEPLLYKKFLFIKLCEQLKALEKKTNTAVYLAITTNGVLVDAEWCAIFNQFQISVTLSLDGDATTHDAHRKDYKGEGTFLKVINALALLQTYGIEPTVLSVCSPQANPGDLLTSLVDDLGVKSFDVLIPEKKFDDSAESIANYYCQLFLLWYEKYAIKGVKIRILDSILETFFGGSPIIDDVGYSAVVTITLLTDGSLEATDTLRIIDDGFTASTFNIMEHEIADMVHDPVWAQAYHHSLSLCDTCKTCKFYLLCGGGPLQSRWSKINGFNNPSIYCEDFKQIFRFITERVKSDLYTTG